MVTTFLVCTDIRTSMRYLSNRHLGKQRTEAMQIINALTDGGGYEHHPAAKMWRGYEYALMYYANCAIAEWIERGNKNTMVYYQLPPSFPFPWWISWDLLHRSHRNLLLRKDFAFYSRYFIFDEAFRNYGYIWPNDSMYYYTYLPIEQLAVKLPDDLVDPRYCPAIIKGGKRPGMPCGVLLRKPEHQLCGTHRRKS